MTEEIQGKEYRLCRFWEQKNGELTTQQRREARAILFGRFGHRKEFFTGDAIDPKKLHTGAYQIHHLTFGPGKNLLPNLRLAYPGPNANANKPKDRSGIRIRDKDRIPVDATTQLRQTVDYGKGSPEMQVNGDAEPDYRSKMWELLEYGRSTITKKRAIYGLAELIGVSPQATRDYLEKMISDDGPLEEFKENGVKRIRVKAKKLKEMEE